MTEPAHSRSFGQGQRQPTLFATKSINRDDVNVAQFALNAGLLMRGTNVHLGKI
jgi:hypothetical protein